jgi:tryptophanase
MKQKPLLNYHNISRKRKLPCNFANTLTELCCSSHPNSSFLCQLILTQRQRSLIERSELLAHTRKHWKELAPTNPLRVQIEDTYAYTKLHLVLTAHHEIFKEGEKVAWENLTQYSG